MRPRIVLAAVLAVAALVGAGFLWFTGRESLEAVDIDRTIADLTGSEDAEGAADPADAVTDPSGSWTVDTSAEAFNAVTGTGTFVGYRIAEVLAGVGDFEAVGRSPQVEGSIVIDGDEVTEARIGADLAELVSDDSRRDSRVRSLFADRPVTFTLTSPVPFEWSAEERQRIGTDAVGILRLGEVEQEVTMRLVAEVVGTRLLVTGSAVVTLADLDVRVPSAPIVLSVADEATIELQLFLTRD
jgi:polyisoprenoid-binding protein YceI